MPMTLPAKIELLDTTLRDGAQSESISYSVHDKLEIVRTLSKLGIPLIEAGIPSSNPKDIEFFELLKGQVFGQSQVVAFGATCRPGVKACDDQGLKELVGACTETVCVFGKAWLLHVDEVLHTTKEENLRMIFDTVSWLASQGKRVIFDAEHFFNGYDDNPDYALSVAATASKAGASVVCLCETNGGMFPEEVFSATAKVVETIGGGCIVGIHTHDDGGLAVANTIAAVRAGATHVQGTLAGFGERCGNANLATVIGDLQLKLNVKCIPDASMKFLTTAVRKIAEVSNVSLPGGLPYVGRRAFAHKGGMHMDGVRKLACSFEHISPELVGNSRRFLISEMSGKSAVIDRINAILPGMTRDDEGVELVLSRLKELEQQGYQFEGADGSFEILVRRILKPYDSFFELERFRLVSELSVGSSDGRITTAMIKISSAGVEEITAAEGNGPVNALDSALRKALEKFYPRLGEMRLSDYKVRVFGMGAATASKVRVLIESTDGHRIWNTVGVSSDIIEASWIALLDSVENKLIHDQLEQEN